MRLLVVSQYFWPETFRVNDIVEELARRGHEVTVLTGRPNYPDGAVFEAFRRDPSSFERYAGAEVLRVPLRPRGRGNLRLLLNYWSFVFWGCLAGPWLLRGRPFDAIFVFETSPITSALPAVLLRRIKRAPLSMWVLDLWPETLAAVGVVRSARLLGWVGRLVGFIYRRCDLILVQSRSFFPNVVRWGGSSARLRYFPAWAEAAFDEAAQARPAEELREHVGRGFNVMFAGNIGDAQDFPAILDAAELLRERTDVRWLIVGDGRAADHVRAEIERRGLQQRMVLLGRHPQERMPAFFAAADALLVSLRREPIFALTIPGKVQSYLASGRPVLAMLDGEGARVVSESGAGLASPAGDSRALADNVARLAGMSAQQRNEMGRRGRAYALREFDRATLMSRLEGWLADPSRPDATFVGDVAG